MMEAVTQILLWSRTIQQTPACCSKALDGPEGSARGFHV